MTARANSILIATICNTIKEASPFALWIADGANRYVADLSGHVRGGGGFTGLAYNDNRLYLAVQANEPCILVLDMALNVIATISDDRFRDLHSLHAAGSALYIASPGNGAIFRHDLATGQTLLYHNRRTGRAEFVVDHAASQGGDRVAVRLAYDHPLARSQTIGFHHDGTPERVYPCRCLLVVIKAAIFCGRNVVLLHESLGVRL